MSAVDDILQQIVDLKSISGKYRDTADKWEQCALGMLAALKSSEAREAKLQERLMETTGALMMVTFPRCGDAGGPMVRVVAHYEDGSEIVSGPHTQRAASDALQKGSVA